jgi:hypothetical protein
MLEMGCQEIARWLEEQPQLLESSDGWKDVQSLMSRISSDPAVSGRSYAILNLIIVPPGRFLIQQGLRSPARLTRIIDRGTHQQYEFETQGQILRFPEDHRSGDQLSRTFLFLDPGHLEKTQTMIALSLSDWEIRDRITENFADGKKPGRKGLSRRVGIPKKATLGQLEKIAKNSTGERRRMAQWQLNMRRGKKRAAGSK